MELKLVRNTFTDKTTQGALFVNGKWECCTLEDKDRGFFQDTPLDIIKEFKVYGETCIPYGRYKIEKHWWEKHKRFAPGLIGVPGFAGILIHSGVTEKDSLGCILVGRKIFNNTLENTRDARQILDQKIFDAIDSGEEVCIEITKLS